MRGSLTVQLVVPSGLVVSAVWCLVIRMSTCCCWFALTLDLCNKTLLSRMWYVWLFGCRGWAAWRVRAPGRDCGWWLAGLVAQLARPVVS